MLALALELHLNNEYVYMPVYSVGPGLANADAKMCHGQLM
jgi:hypothetical protein